MNELPIIPQHRVEGASKEREGAQLQRLNQLFSDIEDHNRENSEGALLGKALGRHIANQLEDEGKSHEETSRTVKDESRAETYSGLAMLKLKYQDNLSHFGIELDQEHSQFDSEHILETLRIRVVDAPVFVSALRANMSMLQSTEHQSLIKKLLESIGRQVYFDSIDGISPEDQKTFSHLGEISAVLAEAGPELDRERIETYRHFNGQGRLESYVTVEQAGLWHKKGEGFGPADWVTDSSPQSLDQKYWKRALDVYQAQKVKGSLGVAPELQDHLLLCISQATEYIQSQTKWPERARSEYLAVLAKYTKEIIGQRALN